MTVDQIKTAVAKYRVELLKYQYESLSAPTDKICGADIDEIGCLQHVLAMCDTVEHLVEQGKIEKAFRWLGFMQGVLWCGGVYSIDQMRDDNR